MIIVAEVHEKSIRLFVCDICNMCIYISVRTYYVRPLSCKD